MISVLHLLISLKTSPKEGKCSAIEMFIVFHDSYF